MQDLVMWVPHTYIDMHTDSSVIYFYPYLQLNIKRKDHRRNVYETLQLCMGQKPIDHEESDARKHTANQTTTT